MADAPSTAAGERPTVLIVEDTEFFLNLARETLQRGYDTLCARSAVEALSLLRDRRVDLVVLDLTLERDDDGLEVLAAAAPKGLPCLVFTAKSETEMWGEAWQRLRKKGATDLLLKGMNIEEQLLSKIRTLLSQH